MTRLPFFLTGTAARLRTSPSSRDDPFSPQSGEQVQERTECGLVFVEPGRAALGHVGHDLDVATQVQVGMPGRRQLAQVRFGEAVLRRDPAQDLRAAVYATAGKEPLTG